MHKVTTINLNGRAYQLEEHGYTELQRYLHDAEAALNGNPDKAEVLADLEQAIADKCDRALKHGKNVVSAEQITAILQEMGAVESDSDGESKSSKDQPARPKRLFVIREGAVILGVCKGIGAYLGIEANIVRVLFILLTLLTHGFAIVLYIGMAIFLPTAKTDTEIAEAYGEPVRAQEVVDRVRERASSPETVQRIADVFMRIFRIAIGIAGTIAAILFGIITFAWVWTLWQLAIGGLQLHGSLSFLNGWRETLAITLAYLMVALPLFLIFRVFSGVAANRPTSRRGNIGEIILLVLWGVVIMGTIAFGSTYAARLRGYVHDHRGYLNIGGSSICVDHSVCDTDGRPVRPILHYRY
jgi:phage shock protein PspC (stress-responsive transcriptional regulator)